MDLSYFSECKWNKSKRKIYLTKQDIQIIKRYRSWIYKTKFCETSYLLKEEPFIEHNMGGFLHKDFGRSTMRTILRLAELPHYTVHSLRHSHVSNLANKNVPIKYISERLGHSSVTVTMDRYAHVFPDQSAEYIEKAQPNFSLELG